MEILSKMKNRLEAFGEVIVDAAYAAYKDEGRGIMAFAMQDVETLLNIEYVPVETLKSFLLPHEVRKVREVVETYDPLSEAVVVFAIANPPIIGATLMTRTAIPSATAH